jgi:hypothetical protein
MLVTTEEDRLRLDVVWVVSLTADRTCATNLTNMLSTVAITAALLLLFAVGLWHV